MEIEDSKSIISATRRDQPKQKSNSSNSRPISPEKSIQRSITITEEDPTQQNQ